MTQVVTFEERPFAATLFSVRARQLLDDVSAQANRAYLSGLIIGGEIAAAQTLELLDPQTDVRIVGGSALGGAYLAALSAAGFQARTLDGGDAVFRGLVRMAREAGLLTHPS